jgi:hypothetical protein
MFNPRLAGRPIRLIDYYEQGKTVGELGDFVYGYITPWAPSWELRGHGVSQELGGTAVLKCIKTSGDTYYLELFVRPSLKDTHPDMYFVQPYEYGEKYEKVYIKAADIVTSRVRTIDGMFVMDIEVTDEHRRAAKEV